MSQRFFKKACACHEKNIRLNPFASLYLDGGIDLLIDGVDAVAEADLNLLLEDDEWSEPASSILGDMDGFLDSSFHIDTVGLCP